MYFPSLMNIKTRRYDNGEIDKLDKWLIALSAKKRKYLNPLQFAQDSGVRQDVAIKLFEEASKTGTLKSIYQVMDVDRIETIEVFYSKEEIPKEIYSNILEDEIKIVNENILVWFKLTEKPISQPPSVQEEIKKEQPPRRYVEALSLAHQNVILNELLDSEQ
ncbi:hypothetical protein [Carnobacterium maltaromaticum]|uniref:hypothetical protein n=1 Tax=Carnobacterium maltaromaticum TaxID=2751 RepID=UPI000704F711|nr:hypothetical protein [Carnobacterium maltaromaticum]